MEKEINTNAHSGSVLAQLIRDEAMIVRLIAQDILTSVLLQKAGASDSEISELNGLELNHIIYDLLLLERSTNKEEIIELYDKLIEDSSKMLLEFPSLGADEMAFNCYLQVKKIRQW